MMSPGEIRQLRKDMGVSQREFGEILNATQAAVSQWESGVKRPDQRTQAILQGLRQKVDEKGQDFVAELLKLAGTVGLVVILAKIFGE
jgi:DNA-binding transcriptional regulator YiaG